MNAYELADDLESYDWYYEHEVTGSDGYTQEIKTCNTKYVWDAANMLRQQADRIAEMEKQGKPVAWMDKNDKTVINLEQKWADDIPLYTTPQTKPLSDEEIWNWFKENTALTKESALRIARAIEERHGIK